MVENGRDPIHQVQNLQNVQLVTVKGLITKAAAVRDINETVDLEKVEGMFAFLIY